MLFKQQTNWKCCTKKVHFPHITLHEALRDGTQAVPVNSNMAKFCCSLLLFEDARALHHKGHRRTLFVLSVAAVCACVSKVVCKNMHDLLLDKFVSVCVSLFVCPVLGAV